MTKPAIKTYFALCALCVAYAWTNPAHADTYRWIDDNGVVNYAEQKPRGVPSDRLTVIEEGKSRRRQSSAASPGTAPAPRPAMGSSSSDVPLNERQQEMLRTLEEAEGTRQEQIARIREDNCERSRRVLANLSAKDRIRVRESDGTERVLPEEERQEKIQQAQNGIVEYCDA